MICPYCGTSNTMCKDSRQKLAYRQRRYLCGNCGGQFRTREYVYSRSKEEAVRLPEGAYEDARR